MNPLPDPLHPAIVHFPIVFILLGTVVAVAAIFWRRYQLPLLAGLLLGLGAVGAWVAVETGESDGGLVENISPQGESLLDSHENWARRTLIVAAVAAAAAGVSVGLFWYPRAARGVGVVAAAIALAASYAVYQTGHRGGALVYKHGAGVSSSAAPAEAVSTTGRERGHD